MIDKDILRLFVGEIPNHLKTDCHNVFEDNYRINVWTSKDSKESTIRIIGLYSSYFVGFVDGDIVDRTREG